MPILKVMGTCRRIKSSISLVAWASTLPAVTPGLGRLYDICFSCSIKLNTSVVRSNPHRSASCRKFGRGAPRETTRGGLRLLLPPCRCTPFRLVWSRTFLPSCPSLSQAYGPKDAWIGLKTNSKSLTVLHCMVLLIFTSLSKPYKAKALDGDRWEALGVRLRYQCHCWRLVPLVAAWK